MEDIFVFQGKSRRNVKESTNLHYYRVEIFYAVIDSQLQELNNRFNEVNMELLLCMVGLIQPIHFFPMVRQNYFDLLSFILMNFQQ